MTAGVYLIFNKDTGQLYPGGSKNIEKRIKQHRINPNKGSHIDRAIQKYGWDRFDWVILEETEPDWKIIGLREKYWIACYNAFKDPYHYNLTIGGEGLGAGKDSPVWRDDLDDNVLVDEYVNQELSLSEIARKYNTHFETVRYRLKNLGIDTSRDKSYRDDIDDEEIIDLYVNQELSGDKISEILNISSTLVYGRLKKNDIKRRDYCGENHKDYRHDLDDDVLLDEFNNNKLSLRKIAEKYDTNSITVAKRLKKLGVDTSRDTKKNTVGYYRVTKEKSSTCRQGFLYVYQYYDNGKLKKIRSVDLKKLEAKVKEKSLPWKKL